MCDYPNCGAKLMLATLKGHYQRKHPVQLPPFRCEEQECDKRFQYKSQATRYYRQRHLDQMTTRLRPKKCDFPVCDQVFIAKAGYMAHYRSKHSTRIQCDSPGCEQVFSSKQKFTRHYKNVHGDQSFVCDFQDVRKSIKPVGTTQRHYIAEHSAQSTKTPSQPPVQCGV